MALTATLLICLLAASWPLPYIVAVESSCTHQHLIDITVTTRTGTPVFGSPNGLPRIWRSLISSIADGDDYNESWLNLDAHIGTHVDAPGHFLHKAYTNGPTVDQLDLNVLMGRSCRCSFQLACLCYILSLAEAVMQVPCPS